MAVAVTQLSRRALLVAIALGLAGCSISESQSPAPSAQTLVGTWQVDLRPTPDAEPYYQDFRITSVEGNAVAGTFYGAEITQGRINTDWGTLRIAFVTEDGSGPYHHSAVLNGESLEGLSNSTGRDFLAYWSATKQ